MKLTTKLTVAGTQNVSQFAARLRAAADAVEAEAAAMEDIDAVGVIITAGEGGPASDMEFQFAVSGTRS